MEDDVARWLATPRADKVALREHAQNQLRSQHVLLSSSSTAVSLVCRGWRACLGRRIRSSDFERLQDARCMPRKALQLTWERSRQIAGPVRPVGRSLGFQENADEAAERLADDAIDRCAVDAVWVPRSGHLAVLEELRRKAPRGTECPMTVAAMRQDLRGQRWWIGRVPPGIQQTQRLEPRNRRPGVNPFDALPARPGYVQKREIGVPHEKPKECGVGPLQWRQCERWWLCSHRSRPGNGEP